MEKDKKILSAMREFGKQLIAEAVVLSDAESHLVEMRELGYDNDMHENFSNYIFANRKFKPQGDDLLRWCGEILVDHVFLEASRALTENASPGPMGMCECNSCCLWPFALPPSHLTKPSYAQASFAFRNFGYPVIGPRRLVLIADSGKYDDIFDKILLWRTYAKEPFHSIRYALHIRSVDGYHAFRRISRDLDKREKELNAEIDKDTEILRQWRNRKKEWAANATRDFGTSTRRNILDRLETLPIVNRLQEISESEYAIDFYPKEWVKQFEVAFIKQLDKSAQEKIALKLKGGRYQGWEDIRSYLEETHYSLFEPLGNRPSIVSEIHASIACFKDPKLVKACAVYKKRFCASKGEFRFRPIS